LGLVAHGGFGGVLVEILLVVGIVAVFVAVWLRERRATRAEREDQSKPQ